MKNKRNICSESKLFVRYCCKLQQKVPRVMHLSLEIPTHPTLGKHGDYTKWKKSNKMPHYMGGKYLF